MEFNFNYQKTELTKNLLLSKYSEETYMEYYLGIPVKKGLFRNPLRQDNNPTCSFFRGKSGDLIFRDFSGAFNGTFIDVVMYKYNCDFKTALRIIANDFGIISYDNLQRNSKPIIINKKRFVDPGSALIQVEIKDFTKGELDWWKDFGITLKTLEKFKVFSCKNIFLNGNLFTTIKAPNLGFGYYGGKLNGKEQWRIYFPRRTKYRFLTNWAATKIQGLEFLPPKGNIIVITKSMKDVMVLDSLGIPAIAPNSENLFIPLSILNNLKGRFKHLVCLYDNDLPGISNMCKFKKEYPELIYTWIPRKYEAKDISDFRKKYGESETINLIAKFVKWLKNLIS